MMKKYNKNYPLIYSTYQSYLRNSYNKLLFTQTRLENLNINFAAKIVCGAYMEYERNKAKENNEDDPIFDTIKQTHLNYIKVLILIYRFLNI